MGREERVKWGLTCEEERAILGALAPVKVTDRDNAHGGTARWERPTAGRERC
jgi:hypothetical protein